MSVNWVRIGSGNGLSPVQGQAITQTNGAILSNGPLGINFSEILIAILTFSFKKMRLKVLSVKLQPFCPVEDELIQQQALSVKYLYFKCDFKTILSHGIELCL